MEIMALESVARFFGTEGAKLAVKRRQKAPTRKCFLLTFFCFFTFSFLGLPKLRLQKIGKNG